MGRQRYKVVLSDLHLGPGPFHEDGSRNLTEEFFYDDLFVELLEYYCSGAYAGAEVELILNGDILNHLNTSADEPDADFLSERVTLERTQAILRGHPKFFDALAAFARKPNRSIVYLIGNHDIGVAWPGVQNLLKERIYPQLRFALDHYQADRIHVEHGNRFQADNRIDLDNLFLTRGREEPVLKIPWGSFFVIHFINPLKKERPYIGKVYPFRLYLRWALIHDTFFALKTVARLVFYFLKLNFSRDPRRNFSLFDTWKILRKFSFPYSLEKEARKILFANPDIRLVTFGHTHHAAYRQFAPGKEYINTGSWNDLIGLDLDSLGKQLRLTFAEIICGGDGTLRASLKQWRGMPRVLSEIH